MANNKRNGTKFENEICKILYDNDFWARPMYPAPDGSQPFDVMAINTNGELFCIECKDCKSGRFKFDRIEDNQFLMFSNLADRMKSNRVFFAFKINNEIYLLELNGFWLYLNATNKKSFNEQEIMQISIPIEKFIKLFKGSE